MDQRAPVHLGTREHCVRLLVPPVPVSIACEFYICMNVMQAVVKK